MGLITTKSSSLKAPRDLRFNGARVFLALLAGVFAVKILTVLLVQELSS
jgi:hypothetical protein